MAPSIKTTAVFVRPFKFASFDEILPAGTYDLETEVPDPIGGTEPRGGTSHVLVHLHPRVSHPGLTRTLTIPLAELDQAIARDKVTRESLVEFFVDELLNDPAIRLVMHPEGVPEVGLSGPCPGPTGFRSGVEDAAHLMATSSNFGHAGFNQEGEMQPWERDGERSDLAANRPFGLPEWIGIPVSRRVTAVCDPIDLDGRRTPESKMEIEVRRHSVKGLASEGAARQKDNDNLEAQLHVEPARTWAGAMKKARFLLQRYAAMPQVQDARVQKLIRRVLGDIARLERREDRNS